MPTYEYICRVCGDFAALRPIAEASAPHPCPKCGELAPRALASPHVRTSWAAIRYVAEARNEKSAHEPATEYRLKSTAGAHRHGHVHQRPWMIGH
ncbi:MAG TPA: zinc ribbon domain-containing protein [Acetobacteraceae bacterium]|nr:zinc ribbon domain-containing protein [Acetobacteraceae bacterium]